MHNERLPAWILQLVGVLGLLACGVFWAFTNRLEPSLLAASGSLIGIGQYVGAVKTLTSGKADPPPPVATTATEEGNAP
jgi:hypothetical protein